MWISGNCSSQETVPVNAANAGKPRIKGKFTGKSSGHCKYGGWSPEGIVRFNELKKLVEEDRVYPQAETMERNCWNFAGVNRKVEAVEGTHKENKGTMLQGLK